jgi:hypothetical protein
VLLEKQRFCCIPGCLLGKVKVQDHRRRPQQLQYLVYSGHPSHTHNYSPLFAGQSA